MPLWQDGLIEVAGHLLLLATHCFFFKGCFAILLLSILMHRFVYLYLYASVKSNKTKTKLKQPQKFLINISRQTVLK